MTTPTKTRAERIAELEIAVARMDARFDNPRASYSEQDRRRHYRLENELNALYDEAEREGEPIHAE